MWKNKEAVKGIKRISELRFAKTSILLVYDIENDVAKVLNTIVSQQPISKKWDKEENRTVFRLEIRVGMEPEDTLRLQNGVKVLNGKIYVRDDEYFGALDVVGGSGKITVTSDTQQVFNWLGKVIHLLLTYYDVYPHQLEQNLIVRRAERERV